MQNSRQADCHSECPSLLFITKAVCRVSVILISLLFLASQKISWQRNSTFFLHFTRWTCLSPLRQIPTNPATYLALQNCYGAAAIHTGLRLKIKQQNESRRSQPVPWVGYHTETTFSWWMIYLLSATY